MPDLKDMELLSHSDFWAKDPAPGTVFFELGNSAMELVGEEIDPEFDDPENAVMVSIGSATSLPDNAFYVVLKWGSWATPENTKIRALRTKAIELMAKEEVGG